jgi:hypothetical protein
MNRPEPDEALTARVAAYIRGGAYPEVHVAQFPLDLGRPGRGGGSGSSTAVVPVTVDAATQSGPLCTTGVTARRVSQARDVATTGAASVAP